MKLTIILPTCRPLHLSVTLDSLAKCEFPRNFDRLIIVENGTAEPKLENVIENASPHLNILYLHCQEGNKSNALNLAINSLKENHLLFLTDDDVQFQKDILVQYAKAADGHETGVVFGGTIVPDYDSLPPPELVPFIPSSMRGYSPDPSKLDLTKTLFIGPNWAVFSDDVKKLGGFDPRFGPGSKSRATGQESQMMLTMRNAGFEFVFLKDAVVKHKIEAHNYTVEFLRDRKFRSGIEAGQRHRIDSSGFSSKIPPWKVIAKAVLYTLLLPFAGVIFSRESYYKVLFGQRFARGFFKGWLSKPANK